MTTDERAKVEALARILFADEDPDNNPTREDGEALWNQRLWDIYEALMEVELI